jgi:PTH1 family peptidyl-tRNA hydrolase
MSGNSKIVFDKNSDILMVFLNNPGEQYNNTPHNVALYYKDEFSNLFDLNFSKFSQKSLVAKTKNKILNSNILFLQPLTYMNNSGVSVGEVANFYKIPPSNTIIFHDDIDLKENDLKLKQGGGHGGHNGLRSCDENISNLYTRIRIGVGRGDKINLENFNQNSNESAKELIKKDVFDFVLSKMNNHWIETQKQKMNIFCKTLPLLISGEYEKFNALTTQNIKLDLKH